MRILLGFLVLCSFPLQAHADCGLPAALGAFRARALRSQSLIRPTLEKAVDDCLNRGKDDAKKLFAKTHDAIAAAVPAVSSGTAIYLDGVNMARLKVLASMKAGTDQARAQAEIAGMRTQINTSGTALKAILERFKVQMTGLETTMRENEGNLTKYGFVLSDKTSGGQPVYPNCNSNRNDNPAGSWAEFREKFYALNTDLNTLQAAVNCQLTETSSR